MAKRISPKDVKSIGPYCCLYDAEKTYTIKIWIELVKPRNKKYHWITVGLDQMDVSLKLELAKIKARKLVWPWPRNDDIRGHLYKKGFKFLKFEEDWKFEYKCQNCSRYSKLGHNCIIA